MHILRQLIYDKRRLVLSRTLRTPSQDWCRLSLPSAGRVRSMQLYGAVTLPVYVCSKNFYNPGDLITVRTLSRLQGHSYPKASDKEHTVSTR
ncbi:hypothetical protein K466DRAFT_581276 [Polyporus arcularius HHB13444]|uniref:Uncharacterized protein n=1 Tax=Polyporus arcularius HHB13444 TaxID=1314778 RepID=A0A5C3PN57_9APHY|nr:hypothetical protein K466DRAFT_590861 [Polyporus arcularius HHB13444]TFK89680.1 hypothetical protein K466DRAFT_584374 [Polyporus arcularius HHB13444]TFK93195.1 hypothetical protein K466DRAFT_581276 [Polyporus arcularius HHB13444]